MSHKKKDSVPTSSAPCTTFLESLPYHFVCSRHGFCWMRTEVADNWFAVVDRFAASSLRMIFVERGCKRILLISERGFAISWRNVNILVLFRRWSMFSSHTAYNFVALCFPWVAVYSSIITLSFMPRNDFFRLYTYMYKRCKLKGFSFEFSDSIFGQNNFPSFWLDGCVG